MLKRLFANTKNPYIAGRDNMQRISVDLSGCQFSLAMPPHMPDIIDPKYCGPKLDIYRRDHYGDQGQLPEYKLGKPPGCILFNREWSLQGKFFEIGTVALFCGVYRVDDLPEGMSCFNPVHFEQVIMRQLYFFHGPPGLAGNEELAPIAWTVPKLNHVNWVYCEAHPDTGCWTESTEEGEEAHIRSHFFTPLDDQYFLDIVFINYSYAPADHSLQAVRKLQKEIMSTAKLSLGANQLKQQQKTAQHWPNTQYNKTRDLEPWIYHQRRAGDENIGEPYEVITQFGSPPPPFMP